MRRKGICSKVHYLKECHPWEFIVTLHWISEVVLQCPELSVQVVVDWNGAAITIKPDKGPIKMFTSTNKRKKPCDLLLRKPLTYLGAGPSSSPISPSSTSIPSSFSSVCYKHSNTFNIHSFWLLLKCSESESDLYLLAESAFLFIFVEHCYIV